MELKERDAKHIWHPLTQHKTHPEVTPIVKAKGSVLYAEDGSQYIDGIASWYTSMYGHCNDYVIEKVYAQMQQLDQIVFSGFTHEPAIELSEKLMRILPDNQQKLFFSDNGSTSTEIGIKMALQYHHNKGNQRDTILAFEEAFHGDTFGAMSASGLSVYNGPFEDHFIKVVRVPVPNQDNLEKVVAKLQQLTLDHNIAGFIYEPLVQGAAGMKIYKAEHLEPLLEICKQHKIICIADEVMTGFGKTGTYFASDQIKIKPDVICMSKSLTAGLIPMAVTSCTQEIYDAFYSDDMGKGLFHAHTYTANPLSCAAAIAGVELLISDEIQNAIEKIHASHIQFGASIENHPKVTNVRVQGVIFAFDLNIEMERYGKLRDQLFTHFKSEGVFLRPLGNTVYILTAFTITSSELQKIYKSILGLLEKM